MPTPINMALYRYLASHGATETEAEAAARTDTTDLVTKADLKAEIADLKSTLIMWTVGIVFTALGLQTVVLIFVLNRLLP